MNYILRERIITLLYLAGAIIFIGAFYSYAYSSLNIPYEVRNLYLTLAYPTDPLYLKIMGSLNNLSGIPEGKQYLTYIFEILIYNCAGFEYLWITGPIFKIFFITIILFGFKKLFGLNVLQQAVLTGFLLALIIVNETTFAERFSRPHITQILIPISLILFFFSDKRNSYIKLILSSVSLAIAVLADPWLVCFFLVYYFFNLIYKKRFKHLMLFVTSFFASVFLIYFLGNVSNNDTNASLQLEYLGFKEIYSIPNFINDYYFSLINDKRLILTILLILVTTFINGSRLQFICILSSIFSGWIPYAILDFSIQAYHIILACNSFLIYILVIEIGKIISKIEIKFNLKQIIFATAITSSLLVVFNTFSKNIFLRSENIYKNYSSVFNRIENLEPACEIVSNDIYARAFTIAFTDNPLSVTEGFYTPLKVPIIIEKIDRSFDLINRNYEFEDKDELLLAKEKFLHYATHNYFSISNSLIAPTMIDSINQFEKDKFKTTFEPWNMAFRT